MKKVLIFLMTSLFAVSISMGQPAKTNKTNTREAKKETKSAKITLKRLEGTAVSAEARYKFESDFGSIPDVTWKRSAYFDEASFSKGGKEMVAFYDLDGLLVGTTSAAKFTDLPKRAQDEIKTKYKDYSIGPVIFFDDNEANTSDMILYGKQFEDEDNYFIELTGGTNKIVVQVHPQGEVNYFTQIR
ncbi:MAG: hypothetical protein Q8868_06845 [Bacteroidota bacterium]|nr:hypothetical protein [Bacteroidota bacterium]